MKVDKIILILPMFMTSTKSALNSYSQCVWHLKFNIKRLIPLALQIPMR